MYEKETNSDASQMTKSHITNSFNNKKDVNDV